MNPKTVFGENNPFDSNSSKEPVSVVENVPATLEIIFPNNQQYDLEGDPIIDDLDEITSMPIEIDSSLRNFDNEPSTSTTTNSAWKKYTPADLKTTTHPSLKKIR